MRGGAGLTSWCKNERICNVGRWIHCHLFCRLGASIGRALARRLSNGLKAGIQRLIDVVSVVRRIDPESIETMTVSGWRETSVPLCFRRRRPKDADILDECVRELRDQILASASVNRLSRVEAQDRPISNYGYSYWLGYRHWSSQFELCTRLWIKLWRPLRVTGRDYGRAEWSRHRPTRPCPNFRHLDGSCQRRHCIKRRNPRFPARERPEAQRSFDPVPDSNLSTVASIDLPNAKACLQLHDVGTRIHFRTSPLYELVIQ
jgi:hypothetical protein